jgi:hypothetical protein
VTVAVQGDHDFTSHLVNGEGPIESFLNNASRNVARKGLNASINATFIELPVAHMASANPVSRRASYTC